MTRYEYIRLSTVHYTSQSNHFIYYHPTFIPLPPSTTARNFLMIRYDKFMETFHDISPVLSHNTTHYPLTIIIKFWLYLQNIHQTSGVMYFFFHFFMIPFPSSLFQSFCLSSLYCKIVSPINFKIYHIGYSNKERMDRWYWDIAIENHECFKFSPNQFIVFFEKFMPKRVLICPTPIQSCS